MERFKLKKISQFLATFLTFVILGSCFKTMVLVEGVTEVRPVNAIPIPAGLFFGSIGAIGCAVGNLVSDLFGTLTDTSVLGFLSNFLAAYMPYRLWYLYTKEEPNVHSYPKLFLYIWISFVSALSASWIVGTGIWLFAGWVPGLALIVFLNDFVFPILFGLPVLIVLTSDSVRIGCVKEPKSCLPISDRTRRILTGLYTVLLMVLTILTHFGDHPAIAKILSVPALILTILIVV